MGILTSFIVTHVSIRTSKTSTAPHGTASQAIGTLPYHSYRVHSFGEVLESRYVFGAGSLDQ